MRTWFLAALLVNAALLLAEFHFGLFDFTDERNTRSEGLEKVVLLPDKTRDDGGLTPPLVLKQMPVSNKNPLIGISDTKDINVQPGSDVKLPVNPANEKAAPYHDALSSPDKGQSPTASVQTTGQTGVNETTKNAGVAQEEKALPIVPASPSAKPISNQAASEIKTATVTEDHKMVMATSNNDIQAPKKNEFESAMPGVPMTAETVRQPQITLPVRSSLKSDNDEAAPGKPAQQVTVENPAPMAIDAATNTGQTNAALIDHSPSPDQRKSKKKGRIHAACYLTEPVKNPGELTALLDKFRPQLSKLSMSIRKSRKHKNYVVYYPAAETPEKSEINAITLKNKYGIKDLMIIKDGEMKGSISLGVFSNEKNAAHAKSLFEQKGIVAEIKPPYPTEDSYLVRAHWTDEQETVAGQLLDELSGYSPGLKRTRSCK